MLIRAFYFYSTVALFGVLFAVTAVTANVGLFDSNASYEVYFTPTHNCTSKITGVIDAAKRTIYVQAYFLTSEPILQALIEAKSRGVEVNIIVDKKNPENHKRMNQMLALGISIWIDYASGIAHNKVMIVDNEKVITGSFNFTYSANHRNRENVLIITDKTLARYYLDNWYSCQIRAKQRMLLKKEEKVSHSNELEKLLIAILSLIRNILEFVFVMAKRI